MIKLFVKNYSFDPQHIKFNFENLFNGDKTLGDNINKVLNENWVSVWNDVQGSYREVFKRIFGTLINDFFSTISKEDAFD